ncbi:MAG: YgiQ family radical SAM protein [Zetaproteobacteria bacterium]|nr:YgiQ family radical SAM protein [Zetaproteobacteria bacterium]
MPTIIPPRQHRHLAELPLSRNEMDALGWDACDIILVTGDAYVDLPSFGMAVMGRFLESHGFRIGIIAQPDWKSADDFRALGQPKLFFGVTSGNMDSMVNHYTSERRIRSNDAYTPNGEPNKRPDRATTVYAQRCREAFKGVAVVIGGIEASLRRVAHYDYWSDKVRRSILADSKADILVFGNGERQILAIAQRLQQGEAIKNLTDIRGTAIICSQRPKGYEYFDITEQEQRLLPIKHDNPYQMASPCSQKQDEVAPPTYIPPQESVLQFPSFESVAENLQHYALASFWLHHELNPGNAHPLIQAHGDRFVWINPPAWPLTTAEMDSVFDLNYSRRPHSSYGQQTIPAYEMIKFSSNIMRGCFGGCSFCSITEHEGKTIQSRSEKSILHEIEQIRDKTPGFTGTISDLGGPTANMYRLQCKSPEIEAACHKPSCVFPDICKQLQTDHTPLIQLYRKARNLRGIKRVLIASGVRYDLAVTSPEYVQELVTHHVGGYLKIAPEHTEEGPLKKMMKPGIGSYNQFKSMFDRFSHAAGKKQFLIPYFIAAHPGTRDEDMLNLALWLKANQYKPDQVQAFLPSPMANATTMYFTGLNALKKIRLNTKQRPDMQVFTPKKKKQRDLHKAFLRYHDSSQWPILREALIRMRRSDLIGYSDTCLVPPATNASPRENAASPRHAFKQRGGKTKPKQPTQRKGRKRY